MKNDPKNIAAQASVPVPSEPQENRAASLIRFWACFFVCLVVLGIISGLMLAGLFLLMGYRVF
jgi:hypothetical protein